MSKGVCEEKIYKAVFKEYAEMLRNFLYYKTGDLKKSEDLVQDTFTKLWENCSKVSPEKSKSYLFTDANNQASNSKLLLKLEGFGIPNQDVQSRELIEEANYKERLEAAISALPEDERLVFLMNRIDHKKYAEIGQDLGLSINAVEKRMHAVLNTLKNIKK